MYADALHLVWCPCDRMEAGCEELSSIHHGTPMCLERFHASSMCSESRLLHSLTHTLPSNDVLSKSSKVCGPHVISQVGVPSYL